MPPEKLRKHAVYMSDSITSYLYLNGDYPAEMMSQVGYLNREGLVVSFDALVEENLTVDTMITHH